MSDEPNTLTGNEATRLAVDIGSDNSSSATFHPDGTIETSERKDSVGVQINADGTGTRTDLPDADLDAELDADLKDEAEGDGEKPPEGEEGGEAEAYDEGLPEFDGDNEEVYAQYKERYIKEDGSVNFEAFNDAFYTTGGITDNQRAFAKKHLGVSDQAIDTYLNGVKDQNAKADAAIHADFGGKENVDAAMAWAVGEGGYTPAQKEAFNAALKKGGEDLSVQLELLRARHDRVASKPVSTETPKVATSQRRKSSPEASATNAAPSGVKVEPYTDLKQYQKDVSAAGDNVRLLREAEARLKASPALYRGR